MGVLSDLIIALADAAEDVRASASPSTSWVGFSFSGMDNVKFATFLSLLSSNSPSADFEQWLDGISAMPDTSDDGPWVFRFSEEAVDLLASIASKDATEFDTLVTAWAATDEFEGWQSADVRVLLREVGDLAESAVLERMAMFLWVSL